MWLLLRFFANLHYSSSMEHQQNSELFDQVAWAEFDCRFRLRFNKMIQAWLCCCGKAKAHEGRGLAEAMPNEAEAQEEVLENEKRGQNIKGQNLNPAGNTCGLALLGQIR